MKTKPIEEILPQKPVEGLISILSRLSFTLNEVVNFGTKILDWDIKKTRKGKDKNVPSVFLRNSIELGDAISLLIEKSSIDPAKILIRSLLENTFGLLYMIEKDEDLRAHCFLVCRINKDIRYYKQFIESEDISKRFISKFIKQEPDFKLENHCNPSEIKAVIKAKEELLNLPLYDEVNVEYHRTCNKNQKRNNNPNWYSLYDGPNSFESLCNYLENTLLYEFQYRKYSENVHVTNVMKGFMKSKNGIDKAHLIQIRDFKDCKEVFYNGVNILLDLYREFIKIRLPEKQIEYDDWYRKFEKIFEKTDWETKFIYRE